MLSYVLKRILAYVPTLLLISVIIFLLRESVPGNRAEDLLIIEQDHTVQRSDGTLAEYRKEAKRLHLDLPSFYFSLRPRSQAAPLGDIYLPERRQWYRQALARGLQLEDINELESELTILLSTCKSEDCLSYQMLRYSRTATLPSQVQAQLSVRSREIIRSMDHDTAPVLGAMPQLSWHGRDNRYHLWMSSLTHISTVRSSRDGRAASAIIGTAASWTLVIALSSLLCGGMLSILLAAYLHRCEDRWHARVVQQLLRVIYATPLFWGATLSIIFLTTSYYSKWLDWFPAAGIFPLLSSDMTWSQRIMETAPALVLPILLLTLYSLPYLVDQLRQSLYVQSRMPYVMTARAAGHGESSILYGHVLPNSLLPFLTICGGRVAGLLSGSLIVEILFGIPGMGKLLYDSVLGRDWDIVMLIALLSAIITMLAYLLTDIGYTLANPKIQWKS